MIVVCSCVLISDGTIYILTLAIYYMYSYIFIFGGAALFIVNADMGLVYFVSQVQIVQNHIFVYTSLYDVCFTVKRIFQ